MSAKNLINRVLKTLVLVYCLLIITVAFWGMESAKIELLIYIISNFLLTYTFFKLINKNKICVFSLSTYLIFILVYVIKGVLQSFIGLDTFWVMISINTVISVDAYVNTLVNVVLAHFVFVACLSVFSYFFTTSSNYQSDEISSVITKKFVLFFVFMLIFLTSYLMSYFELAVMGKDAVNLPFHLTGIIFYSRDLVIPLILLYLLESALKNNNKFEVKLIILIYIVLVFSDIYLRASKSPLFIFILYLFSLYYLISSERSNLDIKVNKLTIISMFILGIILWPIIELYRSALASGHNINISALESVSKSSNFFEIILMFFDRLLGFLQFSGLISDVNFQHQMSLVFQYENIGQYYTKHYLGFMQDGHLSSPSLLGTLYILSSTYWWAVLSIYLLITKIIWVISGYYRRMKNPLRVLLIFLIINTVMAGTVDNALDRIVFIFIFAGLIEVLFSIKVGRKTEL